MLQLVKTLMLQPQEVKEGMLVELATRYPTVAIELIPLISYKDLLCLLNTGIKGCVMDNIYTQLKKDLRSEAPSALASCLPLYGKQAEVIRRWLYLMPQEYEDTILALRAKASCKN